MSKNKNSYKPGKSLKYKDEGIVSKCKFSIDNAKWQIVALIICFHIFPLFFLPLGETGQNMLKQGVMLVANPMMVFAILVFYGVKQGFNCKMPLFSGFIAAASVAMYYKTESMGYTVQTAVIMFIVYSVIAFISDFLGALIKRYLN